MQEIETLFTDLFHHCYDGVIEIYEVVSEGQQLVGNGALAGMSGLGHIAISIGLVWSIVKIFQYESAK